MSKFHFLLGLCIVAVIVCPLNPASLFAQSSYNGQSKEPARDPFKILIVPPKRKHKSQIVKPDPPQHVKKQQIPKLVINVTAIAGKPPHYVAIIKHEGKAYIVEEGFQPANRSFKVRKVYRDKIEVFYSKDKSIKTFLF